MWSNILNKHGIEFGYLDFLKIGVVVAIPMPVTAPDFLRLMLIAVA